MDSDIFQNHTFDSRMWRDRGVTINFRCEVTSVLNDVIVSTNLIPEIITLRHFSRISAMLNHLRN